MRIKIIHKAETVTFDRRKMTSLEWVYISQKDIATLEEAHDMDSLTRFVKSVCFSCFNLTFIVSGKAHLTLMRRSNPAAFYLTCMPVFTYILFELFCTFIARDPYISNTFCRRNNFTPRTISSVLGICHQVVKKDLDRMSTTTMGSSYHNFSQLLLKHSVQRPPNRCGNFALSDHKPDFVIA